MRKEDLLNYYLIRLAVFASIIFLVMVLPVSADETDSNDWDMEFTPYVWALGVTGESGTGTADSDVDIDFFEILEHLNFYGAGYLEAARGDWTLYTDGFFASLGGDSWTTTSLGPFDIGPFTVGPFPLPIDIGVDIRLDMIELGTKYQVGEWTYGSSDHPWSLSVLGGGRYTHLGVNLDLSSHLGGGNHKLDERFFDPFIGTEIEMALTPEWDLLLHGDFGGFGVGSDFTWNAFGLLSYSWREDKRLILGYRGLYQDYESGSGADRFAWDITYYGPVAAIQFAF